MVAKAFNVVFASVLLVQVVYSSSCGVNNIGYNNLGYGSNILSGVTEIITNSNNYGCGGGNIITQGPAILGNVGLVNNAASYIGNVIPIDNIFSVISGSPAYDYPAGLFVESEIAIGGSVAVSGELPFVGAAYFGGDVASAGEAALSYAAGPSVTLNGGGCGYGLGGSVVSSGLGATVVSSGLGFGGTSYNFAPSCGCGY